MVGAAGVRSQAALRSLVQNSVIVKDRELRPCISLMLFGIVRGSSVMRYRQTVAITAAMRNPGLLETAEHLTPYTKKAMQTSSATPADVP